MKKNYGSLVATLGVTGFYAISLGMFAGWAYWMWMAIQMQSFAMFFFGILGPLGVVAALIGFWSLLFGAPVWLVQSVL
jgi:hypothetical protein